MFCSPPGRASAQLGPGRVKILRLAFQVTTASQQKKTPLFVFTSAPPATGQLLSRLITQPRVVLGLFVGCDMNFRGLGLRYIERCSHGDVVVDDVQSQLRRRRPLELVDTRARPRTGWIVAAHRRRGGFDRGANLLVVEFFCGYVAAFDAKEPQITVRVVRRVEENTACGSAAPDSFDVAVAGVMREEHLVVAATR